MNEIASGIFHWTAHHDPIGARVSSYFIAPAGAVLDPKRPEGDGKTALRAFIESPVGHEDFGQSL